MADNAGDDDEVRGVHKFNVNTLFVQYQGIRIVAVFFLILSLIEGLSYIHF